MSSLYKIFFKNIKKNPNTIFIYDLKENFNGAACLKKINFLRKFIRKNKINTIGLKYKNSSDWIFWYLAADSLDKKIIIIKNSTTNKDLNKIKVNYQIEYIAGQIPKNLKINQKTIIKNKIKNIRSDILFTSGTLNLPKGVIISEKAYLHVAKILIQKLKQRNFHIELLSMPFDHSFGIVRLRCCILAGTKMLVTDGLKRFPEIFKFSQENKLSGLSLVPSGLALIKLLLKNKVNLFNRNLKYFEIGSSNINNEQRLWLKKNFTKTEIIHHYGMTEASRSFLISRGVKDNLKKNTNKIGKIIPECKYKIDKTSNELLLKGRNLCDGYFDQENNKDKFFDGWFRTGDIVKKKKNELYLVGRVDNQFNIGGNKVQAEMIENIVESIDHVKKCICFVRPDEIYGNSIALKIEKKSTANKKNILKKLEKKMSKLSDYHNPKKIIFEKILLTKNGKKIRIPQQKFI